MALPEKHTEKEKEESAPMGRCVHGKTAVFPEELELGEDFVRSKKLYTEVFFVDESETGQGTRRRVLLGMKKRGFKEGMLFGFGGKVEKSDLSIGGAAKREVMEECGLIVSADTDSPAEREGQSESVKEGLNEGSKEDVKESEEKKSKESDLKSDSEVIQLEKVGVVFVRFPEKSLEIHAFRGRLPSRALDREAAPPTEALKSPEKTLASVEEKTVTEESRGCSEKRPSVTQQEPQETEEMRPQWFEEAEVPWDLCLPSVRLWLPLAFSGTRFVCAFRLGKQDEVVWKSIRSGFSAEALLEQQEAAERDPDRRH
uniref:Nudix hydrolase domain-containing protein n=1 Tax=Chromera velia CCMP2878 TaxID=1169474 RepID=A0A0G4F5G2_9ALVE|eukprot:Cvel_2767.t1-p1 / transcript=Cvel_2767.t1 / gene=Cvel_2767 / organism=Chromera_velia_CCMP2878 / gene_product=7,8-dihydro-8-oxoguanine triphosphatase, putative / transcript_product=7,8-dihydro-8-oxoguanine triphosphatase, putative / location=Cvel_scaffold111:56570-57508(+) / protein_length=313 / sequence_SO=supercontig / SO=protein_coding / is_pseudo=false